MSDDLSDQSEAQEFDPNEHQRRIRREKIQRERKLIKAVESVSTGVEEVVAEIRSLAPERDNYVDAELALETILLHIRDRDSYLSRPQVITLAGAIETLENIVRVAEYKVQKAVRGDYDWYFNEFDFGRYYTPNGVVEDEEE